MKYNTNLLVFLTWYQSHYSDLFLAIFFLLVWLLFFFFNIASAITTTATAFRRWTSDVTQRSSLGSGPAAVVIKEFHTAQTTAICITATNIAPITVLKVPQRSSCADLKTRESLDAVGDRMCPHALSFQITRLHAPSRAPTHPHALSRACWCHPRQHLPTPLLMSPTCVSCWRHPLTLGIWPLTLTEHWLWPLTFLQGWLFLSRFFLSSFSCRFHFCSLFLHIVSLDG